MNHPSPPFNAQLASPDDRADGITVLVGHRVRAARKAARLSRRAVSETSGVSQRYLAQIEAGEGNISIALLARVGAALGQSVERLVSLNEAATDMASLFANVDQETQAQVSRTLAAAAGAPRQDRRAGRIALIGLRGAGKSTLGRRLGEALGAPFVELNREIEKMSGISVGDVIALYGQEGYRSFEARALDRVIEANDNTVLAVAGGIVSAPETYQTLLARCRTIWLRASPEDHMSRVRAQGDERPMEGNPEAMAELRAILASREELYAQAGAVVDTSGASEDAALRLILDAIN